MDVPCIDHGKSRSVDMAGYARVGLHGRTVLLHRLTLAQHMGVPLSELEGYVVRHTCDNTRCVQPMHLVLGSQADNMRDMVERGRHVPVRKIRRGTRARAA